MRIRTSFFLWIAILTVSFPVFPGHAGNDTPSKLVPRVISSASELDYPPFSVIRDDGSADGFSVELLKAVAGTAGLDVTFKVGPWHKIKQELVEGRLDALPLVSYSKERDEILDFTVPYLRMHGTIFVRKGEKSIQNEIDLNNREVLVMRGDTAHEYAVRNQLSDKLILTDNFEDAMKKLSAGKHDAVIIQHLVGLQLIKKLDISNVISVRSLQETSLKPFGEPLSGFEQKFCIAVKEGDKELLARLNEGLSIVIADGTYDQLYDKWFGPILPQPAVKLAAMVKYLLAVLLPVLLLIGILAIWYLNREIARKTNIIRENEEKFSVVFNKSPFPVSLSRLSDGTLVDVNESWLETFGFSRSEAIGQTYGQLGISTDPEELAHLYDAVMEKGTVKDLELHGYRTRSNASPVMLANMEVIELGGGKYIFTSEQDITDRKKAEAALRRSAQFPEENPNPVLRVAADGTPMYHNAAAQSRLSVLNWRNGQPLPGPLAIAVEKARQQNDTVETELTFPDGRTFGFFAIKPAGEDYVNIYGIDLTERKQVENALRKSEDRIRASLAEKEVLLKEIHHRVKNNMQVISSLVDLQVNEVKDTAMQNIFRDVVYRVRAMAMVHEKLYQSSDLARVDFADYTRSLLGYLWRAQAAATSGVKLDLDLEPVFLSVNAAVPCGLILNELFSNALKHAFDGRNTGQVMVALRGEPQGKVHLCVRDNGIGLPKEIDWRQTKTLGLRLVQMLANQLRADVRVTSDQGAEFAITFERFGT